MDSEMFSSLFDFIQKYYYDELNKEKIEVLKIDCKLMFLLNIDLYEYFISNPDQVYKNLDKLFKKFRGKEDIPSAVFENFMDHNISISEIRKKNLNSVISINGQVLIKTQNYISILRKRWICNDCETHHFIWPRTKKCVKCNGDWLKRDDITHTQAELSLLQENYKKGEYSTIRAIFSEKTLDFFEKIKTSENVKINAVLRSREKAKDKEIRLFYLDVLSVEIKNTGIDSIKLDEQDKKNINKLMSNKNFKNDLLNSMFGDIYGLENVKEALLVQMIGGPKEFYLGSLRNRGNINILIAGSPGVAKSVFLKKISNLMPGSRYASCANASGIGLTASTRKDEISGSFVVEPGAVPLANKSICCIDELDKIDKDDLGKLNTQMDSLYIPVDKGNVHRRITADTSLLCAMNPKERIFDPDEDFYSQININKDTQDRFDLTFGLDSITTKEDQEKIADIVLTPSLNIGVEFDKDTILKYIKYCKEFNPVITKDSKNEIKNLYMDLTSSSMKSHNARFSTRLLKNMLRLSGAFARMRLSNEISVDDVREGYRLMIAAMKSIHLVRETKSGSIEFDTVSSEKVETITNRTKLKVVKKLLLQHKEGIEIEKLKELCNFDALDVEEIITKLKRAGDIFEPTKGTVKIL